MELRWLQGKGWEVISPVPFRGGEVPIGFVSDGITLPVDILRWFIDPSGKALRAAIIHDWNYRTGVFTRKECDEMFKEMLRKDGLNTVKSGIMYRAVRWFGKSHYQGDLEE